MPKLLSIVACVQFKFANAKNFKTDLEARAIRIQKDCTTDLEAFLILVGTPMEGPFRRAPLTNRNTIRKKNMNFQKPLQKLVLCAFRSFLQPMQKGLRNRFRTRFRSFSETRWNPCGRLFANDFTNHEKPGSIFRRAATFRFRRKL